MTSTDRPVRMGLVHPLRAWLDALEAAFRPHVGVEVVVAHTDLGWVLQAVQRGDVDVALISLSGDTGTAPIRALRRARNDVGIVVLSDATDSGFVSEAARAGARGWVASTSSFERLLEVVRGVQRGESWFPPRLVTVLLDHLLETEHSRKEQSDALAGLSVREREILDCLAQGMTRPEIAELLFVSPHTVRTHINNLLRKLSVHSTLAAASIARGAPVNRTRAY